MSTELDLNSIEAQEAAALKETQRLRREELERKAAAAEAEKIAEKSALLPRGPSAELSANAILTDEKLSLDFEGSNGEARHVDVYTKGPRMSKDETLAMRALLNSLGRPGLEVATWEGMNGLIALYKPGKSTCLSDKSFMQLIRSLDSMESGSDTMTVRSYKILLPLYKLMKRRAS